MLNVYVCKSALMHVSLKSKAHTILRICVIENEIRIYAW